MQKYAPPSLIKDSETPVLLGLILLGGKVLETSQIPDAMQLCKVVNNAISVVQKVFILILE